MLGTSNFPMCADYCPVRSDSTWCWTGSWSWTRAQEKVSKFFLFFWCKKSALCFSLPSLLIRPQKRANLDPQPEINPNYISKEGAFNGSGIAIASYSFDKGGYGVINVYYQHWTGQLRKLQLNDDGSWAGGDATTIIAVDARNATPISAVAYAMDYTSKVKKSYEGVISTKKTDMVFLNPTSGTSSTSTRTIRSAKESATTGQTRGGKARLET
jgi:hypothetical protein